MFAAAVESVSDAAGGTAHHRDPSCQGTQHQQAVQQQENKHMCLR